jgi:hypothetical protein
MAQAPFFHEASGAVRFWILVDGTPLGASISREALHHRYRPTTHGDDPLETYLANAADIELAVRRRLAQGSREPVLLREYDLRVLGEQGAA